MQSMQSIALIAKFWSNFYEKTTCIWSNYYDKTTLIFTELMRKRVDKQIEKLNAQYNALNDHREDPKFEIKIKYANAAKKRAEDEREINYNRAEEYAYYWTTFWVFIFSYAVTVFIVYFYGLYIYYSWNSDDQEYQLDKIIQENLDIEKAIVMTQYRGSRKTTTCKKYVANYRYLHPFGAIVYNAKEIDSIDEVIQLVNNIGLPVSAIVTFTIGLLGIPGGFAITHLFGVFGGYCYCKSIYLKFGKRIVIFDDIGNRTHAIKSKSELTGMLYTDIFSLANYNNQKYPQESWLHVVVSSNEGIVNCQADYNSTVYESVDFPTANDDELKAALDYMCKKNKVLDTISVQEINNAAKKYGEWWGRSTRFWLMGLRNPELLERMKTCKLSPEDMIQITKELDLATTSGCAALMYSKPIDIDQVELLKEKRAELEKVYEPAMLKKLPRRLAYAALYHNEMDTILEPFIDQVANKKPEYMNRGFDWKYGRRLILPLKKEKKWFGWKKY